MLKNLSAINFKVRIIGFIAALIVIGGAAALTMRPAITTLINGKDVAAVVGGNTISRAAFDGVFAEYKSNNAADTAENRQIILDSIIVSELLAQQAIKTGITDRSEVKSALEMQQRNLLATAYTQEFLRNHAPNDKALNETYTEWVKSQGATEYKLRSVILPSKDRADEVSRSIRAGDSVDRFLVESLDKQTKGGDLGWLAEGVLSREVKDAVLAAAKSGGRATASIPGQSGWVVLQVEESRAWKAPEFTAVKSALIPAAQQKMLREHIEKLRVDAGLKSR